MPGAKEKLAAGGFAAAILDLMVPGESGDVLLSELVSENPGMPVAIITGYATIDNTLKALLAGAFDFIPKPFSFEELASLIARMKRFIALPPEDRIVLTRAGRVIPGGGITLRLRGHGWVRVKGDEAVEVGIGALLAATAGNVVAIKLPLAGERIAAGQPYAWLTDDEGNEHSARMPVSGRVVSIASEAELAGSDRPRYLSGALPLLTLAPENLEAEIGNLSRSVNGRQE